ncbi:MAG TPA: hypothetical protein VLI04_19860, partial [Nocardioidaceae bacterium]|nr:hypothetical protein [Nocardioidaceae bacterium]
DGGDGGGYYCYPVLDGEGGGESGGLIDPNDFVLRIQLVPGGPWHTPPLCFEYGIVDAGLNDCVGSMFVEENGNITIDFFYLEDGRGLVK